jgi:hypothetical protein
MHSTRNGDHAGAVPAGGSDFQNIGRSCGRSSRVRVPGCDPGDLGANPSGHPNSERTRCRSRRGGGLQTRSYPVRVRACAPFRHAPVAQLLEHRATNAEVAGGSRGSGRYASEKKALSRPAFLPGAPLFPGVAQCRGNELRPRSVRVQVLPSGPMEREPDKRAGTLC